MKYLCLIYYEEQKLNALSKGELDALIDEALAYDEVLRKSGHYLVSNALQSVQTATTVRVRNGRVSVTDGPFARAGRGTTDRHGEGLAQGTPCSRVPAASASAPRRRPRRIGT